MQGLELAIISSQRASAKCMITGRLEKRMPSVGGGGAGKVL